MRFFGFSCLFSTGFKNCPGRSFGLRPGGSSPSLFELRRTRLPPAAVTSPRPASVQTRGRISRLRRRCQRARRGGRLRACARRRPTIRRPAIVAVMQFDRDLGGVFAFVDQFGGFSCHRHPSSEVVFPPFRVGSVAVARTAGRRPLTGIAQTTWIGRPWPRIATPERWVRGRGRDNPPLRLPLRSRPPLRLVRISSLRSSS